MKGKTTIIDLRCPVNPAGPSGKGKNLLRKNARLMGDCSREGIYRLRRYVALKEGVQPENILFGHDRAHCLRALFGVARPSSIGCQWPAPSWVRSFFGEMAVAFKEVELSLTGPEGRPADGPLGKGLEAGTVFVSRPHEVTGEVLTADYLAALVKVLERTGGRLIVDESFRGFVNSDPLGERLIESPCCAILRSFTPFYSLTMLRLAYIVANRETIAALSGAMQEDEISPLACWAALGSLQDRGFVKRTERYYAGERAFMLKSLERLPEVGTRDRAGNSILLIVPSHLEALHEELLSQGILIDGFRDGEGRLYLRLPVSKHAVNARLVRILRRSVEGKRGS